MAYLLEDIRRNPLLWLLLFVPVVFAQQIAPQAHTLLFVLSRLAMVPLAALLSHATESVAAKTGDAVGGLLNATLGNRRDTNMKTDRRAAFMNPPSIVASRRRRRRDA